MLYDHILLQRRQIEMLLRISQSHSWVGETMEMFSRHGSMGMPVVQKKIMEHPCPGCRPGVEPQCLTDPVIIICHIHAVLITGRITMMRIVFHTLYNGMVHQIPYCLKELLVLFLSGLPCTAGFCIS